MGLTPPTAASAFEVGDTPAIWGKAVSHAKHADAYVRDLDHGEKVITFVVWAS